MNLDSMFAKQALPPAGDCATKQYRHPLVEQLPAPIVISLIRICQRDASLAGRSRSISRNVSADSKSGAILWRHTGMAIFMVMAAVATLFTVQNACRRIDFAIR